MFCRIGRSKSQQSIVLCWATSLPVGVGPAPKINIGSRLFTKIKPCWMGLIIRWVIIWKISRVVSLRELGCRSVHQSRLPPRLKLLVGWISVHLNLTSRNFSGTISSRFPPIFFLVKTDSVSTWYDLEDTSSLVIDNYYVLPSPV